MNCWEVLEIEPTTDEREIRRAYAKKLKVTRPDDDPTGYQVLRDAFDEALRIAPYLDKLEDEVDIKEDFCEKSKSENTIDFFGDLSKNAPLEIQPYEPEDPYDESQYEFEIRDINQSGASEFTYTESDALLNEVYRIINMEGEQELEKQWNRFYLALNQLPMEQTEYISWQMWNLLLDVRLENVFVWKQWSEYFNWHSDYKFAQNCNPEYLIYIQDKVQLATDLIKDKEDYTTELRQIPMPILKAVYQRISQRMSYILTLFYLILISPFTKAEEARYQWEYNQITSQIPRLQDVFLYAVICRATLLIGIMIFYVPYIMFESTGFEYNTKIRLLRFLVQSYASFFIILIIGGVLASLIIYAKSLIYKPSLQVTEKSMIIEGIIPLIILIISISLVSDMVNNPIYNFIITSIIALAISKSLDEDYNFWASHFVPGAIIVVILLSFGIITIYSFYIVIASIVLWVNINILVVNFKFSIIKRFMDVDYGLSDKLFTLTNILRLPINFVGLIFYWIFFLPFHSARLYFYVRTRVVFFDITVFALILSLPFLSFVGDYYAFLYALMIYFSVIIQFQIKNWVFRQLGIVL